MNTAAPRRMPRQTWLVRCLCPSCVQAEPWKAGLLERHKAEQQKMFRRLYRKAAPRP